MTIFETEEDARRKKKAIELFAKTFGCFYRKLDQHDVDYKIFDKDGKLIAYAEVGSVIRIIRDAYPLGVSAKKVVKLIDKRIAPVLIWLCDDGIIYGKANKLSGVVKWGGRYPKDNSINESELMIYYDKQKEFKYVRFT